MPLCQELAGWGLCACAGRYCKLSIVTVVSTHTLGGALHAMFLVCTDGLTIFLDRVPGTPRTGVVFALRAVLPHRGGHRLLLCVHRACRDYRFFEADMIHPNDVAVDYIWDKLVKAMFSDDAVRTMFEVCRCARCGNPWKFICLRFDVL